MDGQREEGSFSDVDLQDTNTKDYFIYKKTVHVDKKEMNTVSSHYLEVEGTL